MLYPYVTSEDYWQKSIELLPSGPVWERATAVISGLLYGTAEEQARAHNFLVDLFDEILPVATTELLPAWLETTGFPDECVDLSSDIILQRAAVISRLTATGGASLDYLLELIKSLGAPDDTQFIETKPFRVDVSQVEQPLYGDQWAFVFSVTGNFPIYTFRVDQNRVGEPLRTFTSDSISCTIAKFKPAHTIALFGADIPENQLCFSDGTPFSDGTCFNDGTSIFAYSDSTNHSDGTGFTT